MSAITLKTKKGGMHSFLLTLIVLLIFLFVILQPWNNIKNLWGAAFEVEQCHKSVLTYSGSKIQGMDIQQAIKCPTVYTEVYEKDEERIKQKLAKEMVDCHYKMGAGELDIFSSPTEQMMCITCSHITFEDDAHGKKITGFLDYLDETPVSRTKAQFDDQTILQYLTSNPSRPQIVTPPERPDSSEIDTTKDQSIVYIYSKIDYNTKLEQVIKDMPIDAGLGVGVGFAAAFIVEAPLVLTSAAAIAVFSAMSHDQGTEIPSDFHALTAIVPHDKQFFEEIGCDYYPAEQENK